MASGVSLQLGRLDWSTGLSGVVVRVSGATPTPVPPITIISPHHVQASVCSVFPMSTKKTSTKKTSAKKDRSSSIPEDERDRADIEADRASQAEADPAPYQGDSENTAVYDSR